jgi:hypothetical protein
MALNQENGNKVKNLDHWIGEKINASVLSGEQLAAYQLTCLKETLNSVYLASIQLICCLRWME